MDFVLITIIIPSMVFLMYLMLRRIERLEDDMRELRTIIKARAGEGKA